MYLLNKYPQLELNQSNVFFMHISPKKKKKNHKKLKLHVICYISYANRSVMSWWHAFIQKNCLSKEC